MIVVHSDDDIKTIEIGRLTFDEEETLNSVISKGLDVVLKPKSALVPARTPLGHTPIKQELPDTIYVLMQIRIINVKNLGGSLLSNYRN